MRFANTAELHCGSSRPAEYGSTLDTLAFRCAGRVWQADMQRARYAAWPPCSVPTLRTLPHYSSFGQTLRYMNASECSRRASLLLQRLQRIAALSGGSPVSGGEHLETLGTIAHDRLQLRTERTADPYHFGCAALFGWKLKSSPSLSEASRSSFVMFC